VNWGWAGTDEAPQAAMRLGSRGRFAFEYAVRRTDE
jgi:hypothetical protein